MATMSFKLLFYLAPVLGMALALLAYLANANVWFIASFIGAGLMVPLMQAFWELGEIPPESQ